MNGDKTVILLKENRVFACGTPWCGKENYGRNAVVPLKSIIMMERSEENRLERVSGIQAFPRVLEAVYYPEKEELQRLSDDY